MPWLWAIVVLLVALGSVLGVDPSGRVVVEERGGHLAPTGVVDADEENLGDFLDYLASRLCHRFQPLLREPLRKHRDMSLDWSLLPP